MLVYRSVHIINIQNNATIWALSSMTLALHVYVGILIVEGCLKWTTAHPLKKQKGNGLSTNPYPKENPGFLYVVVITTPLKVLTSTLPPIIMVQWTNRCLQYDRFLSFRGTHFPLNHDYGRKVTLPENNSSPPKIGRAPKGNEKVFQPPIFRCELLVSGSVTLHFKRTRTHHLASPRFQLSMPIHEKNPPGATFTLAATCDFVLFKGFSGLSAWKRGNLVGGSCFW